MTKLVLEELSYQVISAVFEVHNELGPGFLEKVYERALVKEFELRNMFVETQKEIQVSYKNEIVGSYFADILVDGQMIVELKAVAALSPLHEAQLLNYLKATGIKLGFLINMGAHQVEYKRMVF